MPKRSKNSTDGAVFTYHERRKIDHGTSLRRLPGGAVKSWDHCALSLATPSDPVVTPHGVIFEREAIVRELLRQRGDARRAVEEAEDKQRQEEVQRKQEKREREKQEAERFERKQTDVLGEGEGEGKKGEEVAEKSVDSSFWLPSANVEGGTEKKKAGKVSLKTRCPISKKSLRAKDLISLKLKATATDDKSDSSASRFECPVCQTPLTNALKPVALRTGTVLCSHCLKKFALKEKRDPVTSASINVSTDVIPIFNLGTAFAGSVAEQPSSLEAKMYRPSVR